MHGFLKEIFTRQKFQGLFVNTALGNFAGYIAGSLVTLAWTHPALERRRISNLFGLLHRKKVVVHVLPHWLEWLFAVLIGFLVMEIVRYWFNRKRYDAFLSAVQPGTAQGDRSGNAREREAAVVELSDSPRG